MIKYATAKQINFIKELLEQLGEDENKFNLIGITLKEAQILIDKLVKEKEAKK